MKENFGGDNSIMSNKECVEYYQRKRFVVYAMAVGLIVVWIMASVVYG